MKTKLHILFIIVFLVQQYSYAQISPNHYLVNFTDKNKSEYRIDKPQKFLSKRAIERRKKFGIKITTQDLPVNKSYVDSIKSLGFKIINLSKWSNSASVFTTDSLLLDKLKNLSFVSHIGIRNNYEKEGHKQKTNITQLDNSQAIKNKALPVNAFKESKEYAHYHKIYGKSLNQIQIHNGHLMHDASFRGEGMHVAIIDAGFYKVNQLPAFDSLRINNQILGIRDFVDKDTMVFDASEHGMQVLSTMAGNIPGKLLGTAPKAFYWLLRSEQEDNEYIIEEHNWMVAAEFADSAGVDIINSSLGYNLFDNTLQNHTYSDLNGDASLISQAADIAASKGMLLVISAGNEGFNRWKYIVAPADADSVLTVGAVMRNGKRAYFSSFGPSYDNRIKPDVCAIGSSSTVSSTSGRVSTANGTSFSSPIMAGLVTCLWQAHPNLSNMQIIDILRRSSSQYDMPDTSLGYGIPDVYAAHLYAKSIKNSESNSKATLTNKHFNVNVYPNPFKNVFIAEIVNEDFTTAYDLQVEILNSQQQRIFSTTYKSIDKKQKLIRIDKLKEQVSGDYLLKTTIGTTVVSTKIIKKK